MKCGDGNPFNVPVTCVGETEWKAESQHHCQHVSINQATRHRQVHREPPRISPSASAG